ncbi:MAG: hypothetical protein ACK2UO_10165, partial [Caldilineaceae bacterium]
MWVRDGATNTWERVTPEQSIFVVDDAAGLTALGVPARDGLIVWKKDTNTLHVSENGAWIDPHDKPVIVPSVSYSGMFKTTYPNPPEGQLVYSRGEGILWRAYGPSLPDMWEPISPFPNVYDSPADFQKILPTHAGQIAYVRSTGDTYMAVSDRVHTFWEKVPKGTSTLFAADETARHTALPLDKIEQGVLVYQKDTDELWEYIGPVPATSKVLKDPANWQLINSVSGGGGLVDIDDPSGLPDAAAAAAGNFRTLYYIRSIDRIVWYDADTASWVPISTRGYVKSLLADTDPDRHATPLRLGDFSATIQPNHAELKTFDGGVWQTLFSEDLVKEWIAAGSLFQGTVMPGPPKAGAVDLAKLPTPDASTKGNYWTWVGPASYQVHASLTDPAAHAVTVTASPAPPATPDTTVDLTVTVAGGADVGVARPFYLVVETGLPANKHEVTVALDMLATDGSSEIATKLATALNGQFGLGAVAHANVVTLTPAAAQQILSAAALPDGQTPVIGGDLDGEMLQVGDWIQIVTDGAGGFRWAHVPSDLLSKLRGDQLYSIQPWAAGNWERNSVVNYEGRLWRAVSNVAPTDGAPLVQGQPFYIGGRPPMVAYADDTAAQDFFTNAMSGPNCRGKFIILKAGTAGTYNLPSGATITVNPGDGVICTGDKRLGQEGFAVAPGPFIVSVKPTTVVHPLGRVALATPDNAYLVNGPTQYVQRTGLVNPREGQRLVIGAAFTAPPGSPLAGKQFKVGDTVWYTGDIKTPGGAWTHVDALPATAQSLPPANIDAVPSAITVTDTPRFSTFDRLIANLATATEGDVYVIDDLVTVPGRGLAVNYPSGITLNTGDYIQVSSTRGSISAHRGPLPDGTTPVTFTTRIINALSDQWNTIVYWDPYDWLAGSQTLYIGSSISYRGGGPVKHVPPGPKALNLANTDLPNQPGAHYIISRTSLDHYEVTQVATQPLVGEVTLGPTVLPALTVAGHLSGLDEPTISWNSLLNDQIGAVTVTNPNPGAPSTVSLHAGIVLNVEPSAGAIQGTNAGNLAGQSIPATQLALLSTNPPIWLRADQTHFDQNLLFEGTLVADPATITYNRPEIEVPVAPYPSTVIQTANLPGTPWVEIPIESNYHVVLNDIGLPGGGAAMNQVYFV